MFHISKGSRSIRAYDSLIIPAKNKTNSDIEMMLCAVRSTISGLRVLHKSLTLTIGGELDED